MAYIEFKNISKEYKMGELTMIQILKLKKVNLFV